MRKCLWSDGFEAVMAAMNAAGLATHTVTVTNHKVGSRRFEARFAFRDAEGKILSAGHIERTTRYMQMGFEAQILDIIQKHVKLFEPSRIRIAGEPAESDTPTYPRFSAEDPEGFETEWRKPAQQ
jgi:hypothetical protein